jgi:hypothetical protein
MVPVLSTLEQKQEDRGDCNDPEVARLPLLETALRACQVWQRQVFAGDFHNWTVN